MAGRFSWDGKEIRNLPAEILNYCIRDVPRTVLRDIAMRLNKDSIAGNWESLAEKLGFVKSSVLDHLSEKAKVQNTFPGLLMLQEWSCRPGSTAFVLLHALREIQREDAVTMLVEKLYELHSLQLLVSVEDAAGVLQFLRVGTRKSAPLHASLDNILQHPLYWYDIVGPRRDIDWSTTSGLLQGAQLTLKLRHEPDQESMNQIYGTTAAGNNNQQQQSNLQFHHHHHQHNHELHLPPATSASGPQPIDYHNIDRHNLHGSNPNVVGGVGNGGVDDANININTSGSNSSGSSPINVGANQLSRSSGGAGLPSSGGAAGGVGTTAGSAAGEMAKCGTNKFIANIGMNILPTPPAISVTIPVDLASSHTHPQLNVLASGPVRYIKRNELSGSPQQGFHPNIPVTQPRETPSPPPLCGPRSSSPHVQAQQIHGQVSFEPERILENMEPMTHYEPAQGLPNLSLFNTFAGISSVRDSSKDFALPTPSTEGEGGCQPSFTLEKQVHPTSYTDLKQPVSALGGYRMPSEDDETSPKQRVRPNDLPGQSSSREQQMGFGDSGSPDKCKSFRCGSTPAAVSATSVSSLHPDYITHDTIRFWNNPTSPTSSVGSPSCTLHNSLKDLPGPDARNSGAHPYLSSPEEPLPHLHSHHLHFQHFLGLQAPPHPTPRQQGTPPSLNGHLLEGGYVAHSVMERMSDQHFRRTASAPALDPDTIGEENMQLDPSEISGRADERMDCSAEEQNVRTGGRGGEGSGIAATEGGGNPALHVYSNSLPVPGPRDQKPRACTYSSYRPDLGTESPVLVNDGGQYHQSCPQFLDNISSGYMDMSKSSATQHRHGAHSSSPDGMSPDSLARKRSEQDLGNFFYPRDNSHLASSSDMNMPRNRRPLLAQDSDTMMMVEGEAEPPTAGSDYTYIEPDLVREAAGLGVSIAGDGRRVSSGSRPDNRRRSSTGKDDTPHRKRVYHRELSNSELEQVPGWNPHVTAETVEGEMERYINDDGNFVVWRYTVGGRYVISVSHLRSVRHYAVYETEKGCRVFYYIFPKGHRFTSLAELVRHLIAQGVSEPTKIFRTPDGREATSCRGGVRFSHVHLRSPIPRRRRH